MKSCSQFWLFTHVRLWIDSGERRRQSLGFCHFVIITIYCRKEKRKKGKKKERDISGKVNVIYKMKTPDDVSVMQNIQADIMNNISRLYIQAWIFVGGVLAFGIDI